MLPVKVAAAAWVRTISEQGRMALLGFAGEEHAGKVRVLHCGVDIPDTQCMVVAPAVTNWIRIACVAGLVPVKGHKHLLAALRILQDREVHYTCSLIGDGPLKQELAQEVARLGLTGVIFEGRWEPNQVLEHYRHGKFDVTVLTSCLTPEGDKEGIPVCLMEALSFGVPVIATDCGSTSELVDDCVGFLVPEGEPVAIANAIEQLVRDPRLGVERGSVGRERIAALFNERVVAEVLASSFRDTEVGFGL